MTICVDRLYASIEQPVLITRCVFHTLLQPFTLQVAFMRFLLLPFSRVASGKKCSRFRATREKGARPYEGVSIIAHAGLMRAVPHGYFQQFHVESPHFQSQQQTLSTASRVEQA